MGVLWQILRIVLEILDQMAKNNQMAKNDMMAKNLDTRGDGMNESRDKPRGDGMDEMRAEMYKLEAEIEKARQNGEREKEAILSKKLKELDDKYIGMNMQRNSIVGDLIKMKW